MKTTKTKLINFKIEDVSSINNIMGQRGTLFVEATINAEEIEEEYGVEYDGTYTMKWSSSFSENEPHSIPNVRRSEMLDIFLNSKFNEGEAFALSEHTVHDLSHFQEYSIPYIMSHDCMKIKVLIALATKHIVGANIPYGVLPTDTINKLLEDINSSFHLQ